MSETTPGIGPLWESLRVSTLDENPLCRRTYASFRLTGDGLVAAEISALINVSPDVSLVAGDVVAVGGRQVIQGTGVWAIASESTIKSTSLERHLAWLLDVIEPATSELAELRSRRDLHADFFCFWSTDQGHGGPALSAGVLARVAALDAELGIDFYSG